MPVFGKRREKRASGPVRRVAARIARASLRCIVPCYGLRRGRREKSAAGTRDDNADDTTTAGETGRAGHGGAGDAAPGRRDEEIAVSTAAADHGGPVVGRAGIPATDATDGLVDTTAAAAAVTTTTPTTSTGAGESGRAGHGGAGDAASGRRDEEIAVSTAAADECGPVVGRAGIPATGPNDGHDADTTTTTTSTGEIAARVVVCRGRAASGLRWTDARADRVDSCLGLAALTRTIWSDSTFRRTLFHWVGARRAIWPTTLDRYGERSPLAIQIIQTTRVVETASHTTVGRYDSSGSGLSLYENPTLTLEEVGTNITTVDKSEDHNDTIRYEIEQSLLGAVLGAKIHEVANPEGLTARPARNEHRNRTEFSADRSRFGPTTSKTILKDSKLFRQRHNSASHRTKITPGQHNVLKKLRQSYQACRPLLSSPVRNPIGTEQQMFNAGNMHSPIFNPDCKKPPMSNSANMRPPNFSPPHMNPFMSHSPHMDPAISNHDYIHPPTFNSTHMGQPMFNSPHMNSFMSHPPHIDPSISNHAYMHPPTFNPNHMGQPMFNSPHMNSFMSHPPHMDPSLSNHAYLHPPTFNPTHMDQPMFNSPHVGSPMLNPFHMGPSMFKSTYMHPPHLGRPMLSSSHISPPTFDPTYMDPSMFNRDRMSPSFRPN